MVPMALSGPLESVGYRSTGVDYFTPVIDGDLLAGYAIDLAPTGLLTFPPRPMEDK